MGYWHFIICSCLLFGFFNDPYYIAFKATGHGDYGSDEQDATKESDMSVEITIDIFLAVNIIVSALTTFVRDNKWVMDIKTLFCNYARGSMIFDILMVIPTLASN